MSSKQLQEKNYFNFFKIKYILLTFVPSKITKNNKNKYTKRDLCVYKKSERLNLN